MGTLQGARPSALDDSAAVKSIIRDVGGPLLLLLIVLVRPRSNLVSTSNFRRASPDEGVREGGDLGEDEWGEHVAPQKKDEQKRRGGGDKMKVWRRRTRGWSAG